MTAPLLQLGWWNTSLFSAKPGGAAANSPKRWDLARDVVRQLLVGNGGALDVLALGEMSPAEIDALLSLLASPSRFGRVADDNRNIVILYDTTRIRAVGDAKLTALSLGKSYSAGTYAELEIDGAALHLIASHWPSRIVPQEGPRAACGAAVQSRLRELSTAGAAPLVVVGDFNDEPFDHSLTRSLQGTRDRHAVRNNSDLLYNPFWRALGERYPMEAEPPLLGAGTHYSTITPSSGWYTFDQALVSSALLQGSGWTLVEPRTTVLPLDQLRTKLGRPRLEFDHFPIVVTLEWRPPVGATQ
jgi:hypothetical protein